MSSSNLRDKLKILDTTPTKLKGEEFVILNENVSFYEKFISSFVYYVIQKSINTDFIKEIESIFYKWCVRFLTFSFYFYKNKEFLIICFEDFCFTILIEDETSARYAKMLINKLAVTKTYFISPNEGDYIRLKSFCKENDEQIDKVIFPSVKEQEEIQNETSQIVSSINKQILQIPIFNISKDCVSIFMIRRFFYKSSYFIDWSFFEYEKNSPNLKEYEKNEFILLRDISQNTTLAFHKETLHLVVLKYKETAVSFEEFQEEKKLYEKVNELDNIMKCFGFVKNIDNQVTILVLEFMCNGTIQNYLFQKKKIDKYIMSFQILEGLYLLHLNNIIHRDLHPNNIFINHDLDVFIGDFGSSKIYSNSKSLTADIGSIIFSSPELINSQKYSMSTDIYSYGLVLYLIFTESIPYDSKGYFDIIQMKNDINFGHYKEDIKDQTIQKIYSKCLQFDQKERPSIDYIFDEFIKFSFRQYQSKQLKFVCYLVTNKNESIQNKVFSIYSSLLNKKIDISNYTVELIKYMFYYKINEILKYLSYLANHGDLNSRRVIVLSYAILDTDHHIYQKYYINKYLYYYRYDIKQNDFDQYVLDFFYYGDINFDTIEFIEYIKRFADTNNSKAQYILALTYIRSKSATNVDKAINYLSLSSEQKDLKACELLSFILGTKDFGKYDINKSSYYLKLANNRKNYIVAFNLGLLYFENKYCNFDIEKAIYYFTISAKYNYDEAQYYLSCIYLNVYKKINKAIYYLTLSANQNHPNAAYYLGKLYLQGIHVKFDIQKSLHYLTISANQNNSKAQRLLAKIYLNGKEIKKDIEKSIKYFTILANKNDYKSQYYLGYIFYYGIDVKNDVDKSIYYLKKSANQNFSAAQYLLGVIYYENTLIKTDINKSIFYLNLSANQNNRNALLVLGFIYFQGTYIEQDIKKSIFYLTKSANLNHNISQLMLGLIYKKGEYVQMDINKSIYYLTLSANQKNHLAQFVIGEIYYRGELISRNINKAIHYLTLSANQNNSNANFLLGEIYYSNKFIPKDIKKSIHHFKEASSFNEPNAKNFLGVLYKNGEGVKKNIYNAIEYFTEAINKRNCCFSRFNLSRIYYFGIDIEQNKFEAIDLLLKASDENFLPACEFLYFICIFDKSNIPKLKGQKNYFYQKMYNECQEFAIDVLSPIETIIKNPQFFKICSEKILTYIRDIDLLSTNYMNYNYDLYYDLVHTLNPLRINKNLMPINKDFYEGFGLENL